jgi:hypothetical protein
MLHFVMMEFVLLGSQVGVYSVLNRLVESGTFQ